MKNWFNFIAFGFCIGLSIVSFINGHWEAGILQALCGLIQLPFMIGGN